MLFAIIFYDGSRIECSRVEFSTDGKNIIVDGCKVYPVVSVLRMAADII